MSEENMSATTVAPAGTAAERQAAAAARRATYARDADGVADPSTFRAKLPMLAEGIAADGRRNRQSADRDDARQRYLAFPAQFRAQTVERDAKSFYRVEGYATVFDRSYEMWDMFGPYEEEVAGGAADETLAGKPDVVFLVNHRGLSLARTGGPWNGNSSTLDLSSDSTGLRDVAWLNPERSEVKDLMLAIDDKIVTEQSFAFMINEGWWNDDFTKFRIVRFDINRGDVSAVNYGANPHTSIAARQQEILTDLRRMSPPIARAAVASLLKRVDLDIDELARRFEELRHVHEPPPGQAEAAKGRSLAHVEALLEV
jgi:hypothetical protein